MALKDTIHSLKKLISDLDRNLDKSLKGNKAASQRVRTGSIKFAKLAKMFRKESVAVEKKTGGTKKKTAVKKAPVKAMNKKTGSVKRATAKLPAKRK